MPRTKESGNVLMTLHTVVITAKDEEHAAWLAEALSNDGFHVSRNVVRLVSGEDGMVRREVSPE